MLEIAIAELKTLGSLIVIVVVVVHNVVVSVTVIV